MPHSKKYAQKLIRELPVDVSTLLEQDRYWDETFLELYLTHCDEVLFYDPPKGLRFAEIAPRLADLVPERQSPEGRRIHRELRMRSHIAFAGALRGAGSLEESEGEFQTAAKIRDGGPVSSFAPAFFDHRLSVLRITQRRFDNAVALCRESIKVYRSLDNTQQLGEALVVLGVAYGEAGRFEEAIPYYGQALQLTKNKSSRTYHAAIHNLAVALTKAQDLDALKKAHWYIRDAKRRLRNHRNSLPKYKLTWLEGLFWVRGYVDLHAERLFLKARQGFLELKAPFELGLVSLDLSALLQREGRWSEVEELAAHTYGRFHLLSADTEAIAALSMWMDAVRAKKLEKKVLADVRDKLEERWRRQRPAGRKRR